MRLIDRLATVQMSPYWRNILDEATVVVADSVAQYYFEGTDQEIWDVRKDFPNVAPPWPIAFLEARPPAWINSCETGWQRWSQTKGVLAYGAIVFGTPKQELAASLYGPEEGHVRQTMQRLLSDPACVWLLSVAPIFQLEKDGPPTSPFVINTWAIDRDGQVIFLDGQQTIISLQVGGEKIFTNEELRQFHEETAYVTHTVMLTYSFAHCQNIVVREVVPPRKLAKRTRERYGVALRRYSVVEIEPMRRVLRTEGGQVGATGAQRALHICRGHFKTYRERGLFGKHKGTYFWPMFARGEPAVGTVDKAYHVKSRSSEYGTR